MNRSRIAAWVCMISSLLFAGLILGRSLPLAARHSDHSGFPIDRFPWRPGTLQEQRAVLAPVRGQLEALGRGDYAGAMHYFTPRLREWYGSPDALRLAVTATSPEFVHPHQVRFGPIWLDTTGRAAGVPVQVIGQDRMKDGALFLLERGEEAGVFRIAHIRRGQRLPESQARLKAPALKGPGYSGHEAQAGLQR